MSFYEEVRAFFKKYDPARVRLAKRIATVYNTPAKQKAAMKRLIEVYAAGGPSKFDFSAGKTQVVDTVEDVTSKLAAAAEVFTGSSEEE